MATGYRAATKIKHGEPGGEVKEFEAGDPVVGLSKKSMRELWDAGALEEYDTSEEKEMSEEPMVEEVAEGTEAAEGTAEEGAEETATDEGDGESTPEG